MRDADQASRSNNPEGIASVQSHIVISIIMGIAWAGTTVIIGGRDRWTFAIITGLVLTACRLGLGLLYRRRLE